MTMRYRPRYRGRGRFRRRNAAQAARWGRYSARMAATLTDSEGDIGDAESIDLQNGVSGNIYTLRATVRGAAILRSTGTGNPALTNNLTDLHIAMIVFDSDQTQSDLEVQNAQIVRRWRSYNVGGYPYHFETKLPVVNIRSNEECKLLAWAPAVGSSSQVIVNIHVEGHIRRVSGGYDSSIGIL